MTLSSSTMNNGQPVNRTSKRRTEVQTKSFLPVVVCSSPEPATSKHRHPQKQVKGCSAGLVALLLSIPAFLMFGYILGSVVDLSFRGRFFMVGLDSASPSHYEKFPRGWKEYSYKEIRSHFHCRKRSADNAKPLPSLEDWQLLRNTFIEVVDSTKQWDDPVPPSLGYSLEKGIPVPPPYYPKFSQGKGRGLFASRDIKKHELVHDGDQSDVVFPNALAWRRFVFSLPRDFACDSTDWFWTQQHVIYGPYFIHTGMDISVLMNSGGKEYGPGSAPNVMPESGISGKFYALRDIEKGEEILTDYDAYSTKLKGLGL